MVRNVFFDLDGTLVDSRAGIQFSVERALEATGRSVHCEVSKYIGPPIRKLFQSMLGDDIPDFEQLVAEYRASYDFDGCKMAELMPTVSLVLAELKNTARLFIVTNKPEKPTRIMLDHLGVLREFTSIVSLDSFFPHARDKSEALSRTCRLWGANPEESLFVGDTDEDNEAAAKCGMKCVLVNGYGQKRPTIAEVLRCIQ